MHTRIKILFSTFIPLTFCVSVNAAEPTQDPGAVPFSGAKPAQSMNGMQHGNMANMGGPGSMMSEQMKAEHFKSKQDYFIKMVEFSNKILAASDSKEKDRLKSEQLQLMQDHEKNNHDMMQKHMQQMMNQGGSGMGGMMGGMQHGSPAKAQ